MGKYKELESYKHKIAKDLLFDWLTEQNDSGDFVGINPISWRSNYGVFKELKFYETSNPYYFELSKGLIDWEKREKLGMEHRPMTNDEWFDKSINRGKIIFVPDITIFHKGTAAILIEIAHKHFLDNKKINVVRNFYKGYSGCIYEILADDILSLTEKPTKLPIHRRISI